MSDRTVGSAFSLMAIAAVVCGTNAHAQLFLRSASLLKASPEGEGFHPIRDRDINNEECRRWFGRS
jgi:hypothetical protein